MPGLIGRDRETKPFTDIRRELHASNTVGILMPL